MNRDLVPDLGALWRAWWTGGERPAHAALDAALRTALRDPAPADVELVTLARRFRLADTDIVLASIAAWSDAGEAAPTLAEAAELLHAAGWRPDRDLRTLAASSLFDTWLENPGPAAPAQAPLRLAHALALALAGQPRPPSFLQERHASVPLPPSWSGRARDFARRLAHPPRRPQALVLRHGALHGHGRAEAVSWMAAVARHLEHRLLARSPGTPVETLPPWLAPWLELTRSLWLLEGGDPGHALELPTLVGAAAPLLVLAHPQQPVSGDDRELLEVTLPLPGTDERAAVWTWALQRAGRSTAADVGAELARRHRLGPGAICTLAAAAMDAAPADDAALHEATRRALPALGRGLVQGLAHWLDAGAVAPVLIVPPPLERQLALLEARCRERDALGERLTEAARARFGRGVKALLHGPSGTGKTLTGEWLAARIGKSLLRVDTAAVMSKYIGETERNLDRAMDAAEACDAVLLFDEADALFTRRTEVSSSNDRYANAQTSFLLQRLETYDGIALLTSNSRNRFDEAFTRRLDQIVEFTAPTVAERLRLWQALLAADAPLTEAERHRLAIDFEACGGALRNAVVAATVIADGAAPGWHELAIAIALECAKAQRPAPPWAQAAWVAWSTAGGRA
jgi:hypothetical protein